MNDVLRIQLEAARDHARYMVNTYETMLVPVQGEKWRAGALAHWRGRLAEVEALLEEMKGE